MYERLDIERELLSLTSQGQMRAHPNTDYDQFYQVHLIGAIYKLTDASEKSAQRLVWLTAALVGLTVFIVVLTVVIAVQG